MALLDVDSLTKRFATPAGEITALRDVSFTLQPGEILGVVGESGCGKSTLARTVVGINKPDAGRITLAGNDLAGLSGAQGLAIRRRLQMVFQDPFGSLNPRLTIGSILREPFIVHGIGTRAEQLAEARRLVGLVGLPADALDRRPHEFSGGQRQRICIARAIALKPSLVICDEAVSALDVSVQAQIVNLLLDLRDRSGMGYLFISHDVNVIRFISDRVLVMYLGAIVEIGPVRAVAQAPRHPYTMRLLSTLDGAMAREGGRNDEVPSLLSAPAGCRFHRRCPQAAAICAAETPALRAVGLGHMAACHFAEGAAAGQLPAPSIPLPA
jgi:peptide/nickel transport system ATP-binding protein